MVAIYVSPKRKKFTLHKNLLCSISKYFSRNFASFFDEANTSSMYMPEDSASAFAIFVDRLYRATIPNGDTSAYVDDLYDLHVFAEKISMTTVKMENKVMDKIRDISSKHNFFRLAWAASEGL